MSPDGSESTTSGPEPRYIPAARWRVFSRLYDPVIALTMRERRFRGLMLERVDKDLPEGGTVLDLGAGTGTFALALAKRRPDAAVIGVDGDPEILAIARAKTGAAAVEWRQGLAQELPAESAGADVVTTTLLLHHLLAEDKRRALAEAWRVLRPGGRLHVADWGKPADPPMSGAYYVLQAIDGFERTADHRAGRLPDFVADAGFDAVERYGSFRTGFGSLDLLTARRAPEPASRARGSRSAS
jgi:ubiquinone/menaquinone biosynthesis C-methylase UbiE